MLLLPPLIAFLLLVLARWRAQVSFYLLKRASSAAGKSKTPKNGFLRKVFWQLGEQLGRVEGDLEEISILAEFCAQVR